MHPTSNIAALKSYGFWAFWVGVTFISVYPTCNWLTANREITYSLYINTELAIPFVPGFFWIYMSMYVLFLLPAFFLDAEHLKRLGKQLISATLLSGVIFLILPAELGFERTSPASPLYASIYSGLFAIDLPHNLVPSLHVIFSSLIIFSLLEKAELKYQKYALWGWLTLVCLSTLLIHQHHLVDIITGLLVAIYFRNFYKTGEKNV